MNNPDGRKYLSDIKHINGNKGIDYSKDTKDIKDNINVNDVKDVKDISDIKDMIEGRNPVIEAIKAGRPINKIFVARGAKEGSIIKILSMARQSGIITVEADRAKLDSMSVTGAHQGVIAFAAVKEYSEPDDIIKAAEDRGEPPFIIILDEITDAHNLGSILRTADAVGAHGVIIPKRHSVGLNPVVAKSSAGAVEYVPVARVTNLAQTIDYLKKRGIWVAGTDMTGGKAFYEADLKGPLALVVGGEGSGIGRLIKERCDFLVSIPMKGSISSLNAAVAGAVVMYEIFRQREGIPAEGKLKDGKQTAEIPAEGTPAMKKPRRDA